MTPHEAVSRREESLMKWFLKDTVVGIVSAVVILAATAALAGSGVGGIFNLGKTNSVNRPSALVGKTAGAMLRVQNKGSGPAASFQVAAGKAPFAVNSNVTVTNLNADMVDGKSSSDFYAAGSKVADSFHADNANHATNADNANALGGIDASNYMRGVKVKYIADAPSGPEVILKLGDLLMEASCLTPGDQIRLFAATSSDHAWVRTGSQGESDLRLGVPVTIMPGSDSNVLVYHSATGQVVTLQWASWQNGVGPDCQFIGTAFLSP
jgi:hypothetical protein